MTPTAIAIVCFVLLQLAIGAWASRRIASETDYLVAGRNLPVWLAGMSIFATWFGAESVLGASGAVAAEGLSGARADPLGYTLALVLLGLLFAMRLWKTEAMTLGDVFRQRYGVTVERLAALILIPTSLLWGAAQVRALGQILSFETPLGLEAAIVIAAGIAVAYTFLGGLLGDAITDVLQGGVVLLGLLAMLWAVVDALGGVGQAAGHVTADQLSLLGEGESLLVRLDTWAVPVIGAMVVQETVSRVLGCQSANRARSAALLGGAMYLVFGLVPIALGLLGMHLAPEFVGTEDFIPLLARSILDGPLYVLFAGAMISAILSTVDSSLLAVGALAARNLTIHTKKHLEGRSRPWAARLVVVGAGVVAAAMALASDSIYGLVLLADSLGTAGVAVVVVMALYTRFGGPWAAGSALVTALAVTVAGNLMGEALAPFLASLAASAGVYVAVGLVEGAVRRARG